MRNRYPGVCYFCGEMVAKNEGHFEKVIGTKSWRVIHAQCVFEQRKQKKEQAND